MSTAERKEKEKEQRRNAIIDAAERLVFTRSYDEITMDDVASEAQLAKGTLYLYFKNKESLYAAVIIRGVETLRRMMLKAISHKKSGLDRTCATGDAYYEFSQRYPHYFNRMMDVVSLGPDKLGEDVAGALACRNINTMKVIEDAIREGIADGTIRPDAEPKKTAQFLASSTWAAIKLPPDFITRDDMVRFTLEMLRHSLENK